MERQRKNNLVGNSIIRTHQDTMRLKGLGFSQGGLNKKKEKCTTAMCRRHCTDLLMVAEFLKVDCLAPAGPTPSSGCS